MALLIVGAVGFIYSGIYNVAATEPHNPVVYWALHTTAHHSIAA